MVQMKLCASPYYGSTTYSVLLFDTAVQRKDVSYQVCCVSLLQIHYLVSHWGSDANSLGSYSYDAVGKPHYLHEWLRIPVDNLFFAGEATCMNYTGTVHGAFNTGLMAAEECRMRVLERHGDLDILNTVVGEEPGSVPVPLLISRM